MYRNGIDKLPLPQDGTDSCELFKVLKSMDELTAIDRLVKTNQRVQVAVSHNGKGLRWRISADPSAYVSDENMTRGKGYQSLVNTLANLDSVVTNNENLIVLALFQTKESKDYEGMVETLWFAVDPLGVGIDDASGSYNAKRNVFVIEQPVQKIRLTESELKACLYSRIALYDEIEGVLYPIQECAYPSFRSLLNVEVTFNKHGTNAQLAAANFIAERMSEATDIRFIYRERTERVKPLISLVGSRYVQYSQSEFMLEAIQIVQSHTICHVGKWKVTDEWTKVPIIIDSMNALYQPLIECNVSDVFSSAMTVSAYIQIGKGRMLLRRNSACHWSNFKKNGGVKSLFDGLFEAIEDFESSFELLSGQLVTFDQTSLDPFRKVLGIKRFKNADKPKDGVYSVPDLLYQVIDGLHSTELNERWTQELAKAGADFYKTLCSKCGIEDIQSCENETRKAVI